LKFAVRHWPPGLFVLLMVPAQAGVRSLGLYGGWALAFGASPFCNGIVSCLMVGTRGWMSARNIFDCFRGWPKIPCDFAFSEARLAVISERHPTMAAVDPFRPARIHHITRRPAWRVAPASRGSSRASILLAGILGTPTGVGWKSVAGFQKLSENNA
jgi:hypothetical protein